jgi:hypothetical protein
MAKKMVLVDEHVYDDMWKRPPIDTSKSDLNNKLQSQLASSDLPDDVKAKLYQKTLKRFLTLKHQVPDLQPTALNGLVEEPKPLRKVIRKKKPVHWPTVPIRYSHRRRIPWSRLGNE